MLIGKNQHDPFSYGFLNRKKHKEGGRKEKKEVETHFNRGRMNP